MKLLTNIIPLFIVLPLSAAFIIAAVGKKSKRLPDIMPLRTHHRPDLLVKLAINFGQVEDIIEQVNNFLVNLALVVSKVVIAEHDD